MTEKPRPASLIDQHQSVGRQPCLRRSAIETENISAPNNIFVPLKWPRTTSVRVESVQYRKTSNKCGFDGQKKKRKPFTPQTLEQEAIIVTRKNVYFVYVPCGEYADSGCSQSAKFHTGPWTGHQAGLQPSPLHVHSPPHPPQLRRLLCVFG